MSKTSIPLIDTLRGFFDTNRVTLDARHAHELVLTQRLKWWACFYLFLFSALFIGIPLFSIIAYIFDCSRNNSCQRIQFLGMLLVLVPFFLFGLLMTYGSLRKRVIILDNANNRCVQKTYTILGVRTKTYALGELEALDIQKFRRYGRRYAYHVYQLVFYFREQKTYRLAGMLTRPPLGRALVQMRAFLEGQSAVS